MVSYLLMLMHVYSICIIIASVECQVRYSMEEDDEEPLTPPAPAHMPAPPPPPAPTSAAARRHQRCHRKNRGGASAGPLVEDREEDHLLLHHPFCGGRTQRKKVSNRFPNMTFQVNTISPYSRHTIYIYCRNCNI